jgi:LysM repeat protein
MNGFARQLSCVFLAAAICATAHAQTAVHPASSSSQNTELEALSKKIDEQSAKIDALSQHLLKIETQLSKPGVMIGETTPVPAATTAAPAAEATHAATSGNSHIVARGETLTSIAKMHKVGVEELQRFNHIENDRKLQIGQIIQIPVAGAIAPSPTPGASVVPDE